MKPDYEKRLERAITEKLRTLPELSAPEQLAGRVMSAINLRSALPWYRRAWPTWPPVAQTASLLLLLTAFGGLCLASSKISEAGNHARIIPHMGDWLSTMNVIWNTINVLVSAALLSLKQLAPNFFFVCILIAAFTYAACIGLGTVIFRQFKKSHL